MSHYKALKQQEELYQQAKIGTEQLKTIVDCNTEVIKALTDKCIQELKEEIPKCLLSHSRGQFLFIKIATQ